MSFPLQSAPITAQAAFDVGTSPEKGQGVTIGISGDFNGSTATAGYRLKDGTVINYSGSDAQLTANGEISIVTGQALPIVITTSVANPNGIIAVTTFW